MLCGLMATLACAGNVFSSVFVVLINKRIVDFDKFNHIVFITGCHFYANFIGCCLLLLLGGFKYKTPNSFVALFRITLGSLCSIIFMNKSLAANSVGFFQVSKLCCIPVTLILEHLLGIRHQVLDLEMIVSLCMVMVGMVFVTVHDVSIQPVGFLWAICSVLSTSLAQIYFGQMQKLAELDTPQLLFYTSPFLTIGAFASVPLFESTDDLFNTVVTKHLAVDILSSCGVSFVLNLSNYYVLAWTTPLSYMIIGYLKTILIFACGIVFFDSFPSQRVLAGMTLTLVGMILYSNAKYRQQQQLQLLPKEVDESKMVEQVSSTTVCDKA